MKRHPLAFTSNFRFQIALMNTPLPLRYSRGTTFVSNMSGRTQPLNVRTRKGL